MSAAPSVSRLLRLRVVLGGLWLGGLAAVGLIGAPTAFALIPERLQAAALAAHMFYLMALAGIVLGAVLLVLERRRAEGMNRSLLLVLGGLFFDVLGEFGVVPQLWQAAQTHAASAGLWHGAASAVYALQALCVLVYVWTAPAGDAAD